MGKGRQFAPSQEEHGIWFQHRGIAPVMENRATGTTTGDMLNNTKVCTDQYQPPIFVEKMSQPHSDNAFSCHDNRNAFQDHGVYFGQNLGKSKIAHEAGQHTSQDVVTWDTSQGKSLPVSETSGNYTDVPPAVIIKNRRYPITYGQPTSGPVKLQNDATTWAKKDEDIPRTFLQTLANTQKWLQVTGQKTNAVKPNASKSSSIDEPHSKHNNWKYSFHAKSFSSTHQPKKVS